MFFGDRITIHGRTKRSKAADVDYSANARIKVCAYLVKVAAPSLIYFKKFLIGGGCLQASAMNNSINTLYSRLQGLWQCQITLHELRQKWFYEIKAGIFMNQTADGKPLSQQRFYYMQSNKTGRAGY
jgi:hypothetical protein